MNMIRTISTLAVMACGSAVAAAPISFTDTQVMTSNGQDFVFNFSGLALSDGTDGTLTITSGTSQTAPGLFDGFDLDGTNEHFNVYIEGDDLGRFSCSPGAGATIIPGSTGGVDCDFSLTLTVNGTDLAGYLADGTLSVTIDMSGAVSHLGDLDELIVGGSYESVSTVPLPATGGALMTGLAAILLMRRRRG